MIWEVEASFRDSKAVKDVRILGQGLVDDFFATDAHFRDRLYVLDSLDHLLAASFDVVLERGLNDLAVAVLKDSPC